MKTLKIGIASYDAMKARTMAVARGKIKPKRGEPKIWFTSMESFSKILSDKNRDLLRLIADAQPESMTELADLSGRAKSNLSRTLRTMEGYGLVRLDKKPDGKIAPHVSYEDIVLDVPIKLHEPAGV